MRTILHVPGLPNISEAIDFYAGMDTISDIELSASDEGDRMWEQYLRMSGVIIELDSSGHDGTAIGRPLSRPDR